MKEEYISLKKATEYCNYSADYLKLRARQGKLKAVKLGRNWFTTRKWLEDYENQVSKEVLRKRKGNIPLFNISFFYYFKWIFLVIFISVLLLAILFFFQPSLEPFLNKIIPVKIVDIERKTD